MTQTWAVAEIIPGSTPPATDIVKLTDALNSLKSNFIGTSLPTANLVAGMYGIDTANDLYVRNSANSAWVFIGNINSIRLGAAALAGSASQTFQGSTLKAATTIGVGNATPAASGAGITFPATQSASSDANTLDDYEEGSFTGTFTGFTTSPTAAFSYIKVGNLVTISSNGWVSATSNSVNKTITGLPATLYPSGVRYVIIVTADNGALPVPVGRLDIAAAGTMDMYPNFNGNNWTNSGVAQIIPTTFSYVL